jgi:hypothetical protein
VSQKFCTRVRKTSITGWPRRKSTFVAEVALIRLKTLEKPHRPFQLFPRSKGIITLNFSGIAL